jgi:hypothetical protein
LLGNELGIDIESSEVVDKARDLQVEFIRQDVIQQRGLAGAKEASDQRHWDRTLLSTSCKDPVLIIQK